MTDTIRVAVIIDWSLEKLEILYIICSAQGVVVSEDKAKAEAMVQGMQLAFRLANVPSHFQLQNETDLTIEFDAHFDQVLA